MAVASKKVGPGVEVLYTTAALRSAIRDVLGEPQPEDRRVALVAYIGGAGERFLPDPEGLKIVCRLQPGATDAFTLGRLKKRGAILFKSSDLHMKVYWSNRKGCVICSANASDNALGGGGLVEAGVRLPPGVVDIDRLWTAANPDEVSAGDLSDLARNTPAHKQPGSQGSGARAPSFQEWTETEGVQSWKLGWWEVEWASSKAAREKALRSYGIKKPHDYLFFAKGQAAADEWFLAFDLKEPATVAWFRADFVIKVPKDDKKAYAAEYPNEAVMLRPLQNYEPPPFNLDGSFRKAFKLAVNEFGADKIRKLNDLTPSSDFIRHIKEALPSKKLRGR